jgi:DsbC/DsbD-like thiol-disulfide interchange protein
MIRSRLLLPLFAAILALSPLPADAQSGGRNLADIVQLELLPGWRRADGSHMAGLLIRLAPGWKTYWRSPGSAGIPPQLQMRDRRGLQGVQLFWPVPDIFYTAGYRSIGYYDEVLLPLQVNLAPGQGELRIRGSISIGACLDVCLPVSLDFRGTLQPGGAPDPRITAALADRALTAIEAGVGTVICRLTPIADGMRVQARIPVARQGATEVVVFELPDEGTWISESEATRSGGTLTATADIIPADAGPFAMDRSSLRMTVIGDGTAIDILGCRG